MTAGREQDARETADVRTAMLADAIRRCTEMWPTPLGPSEAWEVARYGVLPVLALLPSPPATTGAGPLDDAPRKRHACGCVTVFDVGAWESVLLTRCAMHAASSPPATDGDAAMNEAEVRAWVSDYERDRCTCGGSPAWVDPREARHVVGCPNIPRDTETETRP